MRTWHRARSRRPLLAQLVQVTRSVGAGEDSAVFPQGCEPAVAALVMRSLGSVMAFQREANQQLRAAQAGPAGGSRVQCPCEVVGLGDEVTRTSRRHHSSVTPRLRGDTPEDLATGPGDNVPGARRSAVRSASPNLNQPGANTSVLVPSTSQ